MHKPHEIPFRLRFWHFLRGLLFYNTVYWKRASDDLKPPRLTREERLKLQPSADLDIIRPRERPRAKMPATPAGQSSAQLPAASAQTAVPVPAIATRKLLPNSTVDLPAGATMKFEVPLTDTRVKRRRYRRRRNTQRASRSSMILAANAGDGFFARLLKRIAH